VILQYFITRFALILEINRFWIWQSKWWASSDPHHGNRIRVTALAACIVFKKQGDTAVSAIERFSFQRWKITRWPIFNIELGEKITYTSSFHLENGKLEKPINWKTILGKFPYKTNFWRMEPICSISQSHFRNESLKTTESILMLTRRDLIKLVVLWTS